MMHTKFFNMNPEVVSKLLEDVDIGKFLTGPEVKHFFAELDEQPRRPILMSGVKKEYLIYHVIDLTEDESDEETHITLDSPGSCNEIDAMDIYSPTPTFQSDTTTVDSLSSTDYDNISVSEVVEEINVVIEETIPENLLSKPLGNQNIYTVQIDEQLYILLDEKKQETMNRISSMTSDEIQVSILRPIPDFSFTSKELAEKIRNLDNNQRQTMNSVYTDTEQVTEDLNGNNIEVSNEGIFPEVQMETTEGRVDEEISELDMSQETKLYLLEKYQNTWADISKEDLVYAKTEDELKVLYEDANCVIYTDKMEDGEPQYDMRINNMPETENLSSEDLLDMLFERSKHLLPHESNEDFEGINEELNFV